METKPRIGLEIHVVLATASKLFCRCASAFGGEPNSRVCPVCLGHPGTLPVLNRRAVELAVVAALALGCTINLTSRFDRKNYLYPDLPKGYQITQHYLPLARDGRVEWDSAAGVQSAAIRRVHIEEDAARLYHSKQSTLVDCNRAGIPLVEIVTAPELIDPGQARACLEAIRALLIAAGVSNCRMEEGSLRCDANVSLTGGARVEVKNLNSFKALELALKYEIKRQATLMEHGGQVAASTVRWDEANRVTLPMRAKEGAGEYRYFPEPDLPQLVMEQQLVDRLAHTLPELPPALAKRLKQQYGLKPEQARLLAADQPLARWFERLVAAGAPAREGVNWLLGPLASHLNDAGVSIDGLRINPGQLARLIVLQQRGRISHTAARRVLHMLLEQGGEPEALMEKMGVVQINELEQIESLVEQVLARHSQAASDYRSGKDRALEFLVGQVMRLSDGRANPATVNRLLRQKLSRDNLS